MKTSLVNTNKLHTCFITTKTKLLTLLVVFLASFGWGQTTLISPTGDGGFENGSTFAANGWTTVNPSTDQWSIGSVPVVSAGTNCAYVSSNGGVAWTYSQLSIYNHMYRDVTIPSGETKITLSFKWKATGEGTTISDWDNLKIFWGATSITPTNTTAVSGATQLSGPGAISGMYKLSSTSWNSETITFTAAPGTYRLFFQWKSDNADIVNPPAALDEISLVSAVPVAANAAPITYGATLITNTGMTINWVDNSTNETSFNVYRSTDNVNFILSGSAISSTSSGSTGNSYSQAQTGLTPGVTYYYRIAANFEAESAYLTGNSTTTAAATYYYVGAATGSDFSTAASWNTNADGTGTNRTTSANSDILIVDGIGTTNTAGGITIALATSQSLGALQITNNTAVTLQSSSTTTRTLTLTGSVGDELSIPSGSSLSLTNATQAAAIVFSTGTGMTGTIGGTVNFAGSTSNAITTTGGTGTLVTVASTGVVNLGATANSLVGSTTTLSFLAGSNCNSTGATTGAPPVPLATWDAASTLTISGLTASTTTASNNVQSFGNFVFNCPALTSTLSFFTSSTTAVIKGNLVISAAGATAGTGTFRALTSGTLTVNGDVIITQGKFQSASSTGTFNVLGNTTISTNGILDINGGTYNQRGTTFTNDGTLTAVAGSTRLAFAPLTSIAQTFAGSGTVLTNIGGLSLSNPAGLTITHTNQIITLRVNLFQGTITGSNKITFGTGLALGCITQIGSSGLTAPGGSFDTAPTFNLGTGTYGVIYQQESLNRTTGFEIPPSRTVSDVTISNTNGLTIAGGNLDVTTTLTLTAGVVTTSTGNVLGLGSAGTLSGTPTSANMVNGPFNRTFAASRTASGTYTNATVLPVGKGGAYTPIFIDPTTTAGGAVTFKGEAFTTNSGTLGSGVTILASTRYEAVPTTGAANLTSAFVRLTDANVVSASKLLQASSAAGSYESLPLVTNFATGILTTATAIPAASYTGFLSFGEVTPCSAPADQATAILFPVKSTTTLTASYTAAASNPTGYLVVRTASGTPATNPVDQTNYSAGATALGGAIAYVGAALTFNQTGLNANTAYDYTIFSFNNSGCGGPVYNTTSPTTASVTTCATATGTPGTPTLSNNASTSFTASWTASSTTGVNYIIDVATNSGFTTFVSGYQALNVGTALTTNITGLTAATPYWVRVRADLSGCISSNSNSLAVTTECNSTTSFPYTENFTTYLPACWSEGDLGNLTAGPSSIAGSSTSDWIEDGFLNSGSTGSAKMNIDAATGSEWLLSPFYSIPSTGFRVKYSVGATNWNAATAVTNWEADDFVELLVSTTSANWTVLNTYNASNVPSHLGQVDNVDISAYNGQTVRFAFRAFEGSSDGSADIDFFIDNFTIELTPPPTWTGATSTDWNTASNWNPASVPTSADNIVIPSTVITYFPVATSLTIDAGKTVTLNTNARLTVNGTITNNGTLTLESGATLVQTGNTVAGSGTFNVKQALTGAGGATPSGRFWYLGSPVSGATSNVFNAAGDNRLWTHSEANLAYTEIFANNVSMAPLNGHVVRLGANETSIFTGGMLNTGNYTNSTLTNSGTGSANGYTLVSNPYPSYLNWDDAFAGATGINSSIWYRSHNSTSNTMVFDIYNATGAVATSNAGVTIDKYIPPMQAFWVYNPTNGTSGTLTFSNSMRSHQSNGGLKSTTDFPAFVRLNLENDGAIDQTVLYFDNNAAAGYDNFDSDKMMLANAAQVYSFVDNKKLAINGMKSVKANKQVPLTVEFPTAKSYALNATEVVMTDGIVLLEDRLTKVFQDLTMNPVYEFEAAAGTAADRFVVHFQANGGVAGIETAEDNGIAIVSNATGLVTITLSEELPAVGTIQIIDANGKVIATQAINEQATTMNINAATGIYHVLVDTSSKIARKKIVITK